MTLKDVEYSDLGVERARWTRALIWLAVVGVFPLSLAQWGPWMIEQVAIRFPGDTTAMSQQSLSFGYAGLTGFLFAHGLSNRFLLQGVMWLWLGFAPAGILLALALVWRSASRGAAIAYIVWLIVATCGSAIAAVQLFGETPRVICEGPGSCPTISLLSRQPGWGAWLTLGALALLWVAAGARMFGPRAAFAPTNAAQPPERASGASHLKVVWRLGAAAFSLGGLTWGFGLILTPWTTHNCTGFPISWTHFTHGACAGLDANDAIPFVWSASTQETIFNFTSFLVFMGLLGVVAVFMLRRGWSGPVVATIWAALATWLFLQVRTGLEALLKHPTQLGFATDGAWVTGAGPLVTGVGMALCWAGVIIVWISAAGLFRPKSGANDLISQYESIGAERS